MNKMFIHSEISQDDVDAFHADGMNWLNRKAIHTIISRSVYNKLLVYGKGQLNTGIETILELVEKREVIVNIQTQLVI
ncbi:MAG: hypothetical protein MPEBLZ_04384 [Candidatus Methanoperedens nitroreducens]|uniref:Uncharacterized protein n=1 Tax=Candidatus Methanoperedens nitratireducens TaxID=1392998 RepID=A0A0P8CF21_9EURY|nr:MAG: hypothetical protein F9K14_03230 [Candidatus Methanoperedens sp.]KPQ41070.1 MAG: hypothetical protein MPEBLZ_04384 [Candidatus Methanoperedens sp. BLZ1]MBZ0175244.1 hypothetical protein [Candidatus Methanoperedens nitroreducens]MCX9076517.1 hypothetical protein [Candidatus Methanoperedens sp.]